MSELRQRLRAAIERGESDVCGCDDHRGPAHDIAADLSVAAVAAWLRERAAKLDEATELAREAVAQAPFSAYARLAGATSMGAAGALRKAADEIAPTGDDHARARP